MSASALHDRFIERFLRSQDRIYAYIVTLLPNRADAEDVFQQTSLILWKKWQEFDPARDFVAWACGIAHYEVRNFLRKQPDKARVYLSEDLLEEVGRLRSEQQDMLEARRSALRRCLDRLGQAHRELLERCYAGKDPIKVIAAARGQTPNVLYMTLKRLRRSLFLCINRTLAGEGLA
jgi:RNA polymerase sigma-70 factor (ECF subfamily)